MIICGCAYVSYIKDPFVDIPNFYRVNDDLYRGGHPTEKGIKELKSLGVKTVLSLEENSDKLTEEKHIVLESGIDFYNIPLSIYKRPGDKQVIRFLEIVLNKDKQPVFIHCSNGRDRTGTMIAMYRVVVEGLSIKNAYKEAKQYGFWPYRGDAELKNFIHQLKDKIIYFKKAKELTHED